MPEWEMGHVVVFCNILQCLPGNGPIGSKSIANCDIELRTVLAVFIDTNIARVLAAVR
jgi:hypothetical protein